MSVFAAALLSDTDKFCPEKPKKPKKPKYFAKMIVFYYIFAVFVCFETRFLTPKSRKSQHNFKKHIVFIAFLQSGQIIRAALAGIAHMLIFAKTQ